MALNGAGAFTRLYSWEDDRDANIKVRADRMDAELDGIATALSTALYKDGQQAATANQPMGNFKHTGVGDAAARNQYAGAGQVQDGAFIWCGTAGGTADAITLSPSPAITALATGMELRWKASSSANTGAATIAVSGLSAVAAEANDAALAAGQHEANKYYRGLYDGTALQIEKISGVSSFAATLLDDADAGAARTTLAALGSGDDGSVLTGLVKQGVHTVWVPAAAMRPTVSNGCSALTAVETTAGRPDILVFDFDASSDEHAQFQIAFPESWDESTITFQAFWTSTATDTDGVTWGLQGVSISDGDTIDAAYGTAVTVDDANQSTAEDLYVTAESGAVTIAGSPAAGDLCYFRVFRDVSDANDTATEDARLIGIKILYTIAAGDDS